MVAGLWWKIFPFWIYGSNLWKITFPFPVLFVYKHTEVPCHNTAVRCGYWICFRDWLTGLYNYYYIDSFSLAFAKLIQSRNSSHYTIIFVVTDSVSGFDLHLPSSTQWVLLLLLMLSHDTNMFCGTDFSGFD